MSTSSKKRATFHSRLGFFLVSAGCGGGLGNVWKFPYICGENGGGDVQSTSTFFNTCREDRDTARKEEIANLDAIINVEGDEYETARANAVAQKQTIVKAMEMEMLLENLLKAKGFEDVVVSVGTSSNSVNVIVAADGLTRENTAVIYKTVATETGYEADYIRILPI